MAMPNCRMFDRHCDLRADCPGVLDRRQQQAHERADDGDHHQQLDQREAPAWDLTSLVSHHNPVCSMQLQNQRSRALVY